MWPRGCGRGGIKNTKFLFFSKFLKKSSQNKKHKFRRKLNIFRTGVWPGKGVWGGGGGCSKISKKCPNTKKAKMYGDVGEVSEKAGK